MIKWHVAVAMLEIISTLGPSGDKQQNAKGPWSQPVMDMISGMGIKNYTLIWSKEFYGKDTGNGSYDGALGLLQRNEADLLPVPMPIDFPFDGVATMGTLVYRMEGRIYSVIVVTPHQSDVLHVFREFGAEVVIQLVLSCVCFVLLLSEVETDSEAPYTGGYLVRSVSFIWHFGNLLILNPLLNPRSMAGKGLLHFYATSFMFFTWFWTNMMGTDMTTYDTSRVMHKLEDVARLKDVTPLMLNVDQYVAILESHRNRGNLHFDQVMSKVKTVRPASPSDLRQGNIPLLQTWLQRLDMMVKGRLVFIGSDLVIHSAFGGLCGYFSQHFRVRIYPGQEALIPKVMAQFYGRNISKERQRDLDSGARRVFEQGISSKIIDTCKTSMFSDSIFLTKGPVKGCFTSFDDHMKDVEPIDDQVVKLVNVMGAFILLSGGLLAAAVALIMELDLVHKQFRGLRNYVLRLNVMRAKTVKRVKAVLRRKWRKPSEPRPQPVPFLVPWTGTQVGSRSRANYRAARGNQP